MSAQALAVADLLTRVRESRTRLERLPDQLWPPSAEVAYDCQSAVVDRLIASHQDGRTAGYKIACTNETAQRQLRTDGPFYGRLLGPTNHLTKARVRAADFFMRVIEPEFGFEMGEDLAPRQMPYSVDQVTPAIASVIPAIEIVDSRFVDWLSVGMNSLIADNACHGAWVRGPSSKLAGDLAGHEVRLYVNGKIERTGFGRNVLGSPVNALTWLVNKLSEHGRTLRRGDLVTTGVVCEVYFANPGDHIRADFGTLGAVELTFE